MQGRTEIFRKILLLAWRREVRAASEEIIGHLRVRGCNIQPASFEFSDDFLDMGSEKIIVSSYRLPSAFMHWRMIPHSGNWRSSAVADTYINKGKFRYTL